MYAVVHVDSLAAQDQILMHKDTYGNNLDDLVSYLSQLASELRPIKETCWRLNVMQLSLI